MWSTEKSSKTFLIILGTIGCIAALGGLLMFVVGTMFFDDPNASYSVFVAGVLGVPTLILVAFFISFRLHSRKRFRLSTFISGLISIAIILILAVNIAWGYWKKAQRPDFFAIPTATVFVCPDHQEVLEIFDPKTRTGTVVLTPRDGT